MHTYICIYAIYNIYISPSILYDAQIPRNDPCQQNEEHTLVTTSWFKIFPQNMYRVDSLHFLKAFDFSGATDMSV